MTDPTIASWSRESDLLFQLRQLREENKRLREDQQGVKPVVWDKPSDKFNEWWNGDYEDPANPFEKDSGAWWAWAGWQAAQRPWVGLTDEEIEAIGDKVANEQLVGPVSNFRVRLARAIEQTLKEKNHG